MVVVFSDQADENCNQVSAKTTIVESTLAAKLYVNFVKC